MAAIQVKNHAGNIKYKRKNTSIIQHPAAEKQTVKSPESTRKVPPEGDFVELRRRGEVRGVDVFTAQSEDD